MGRTEVVRRDDERLEGMGDGTLVQSGQAGVAGTAAREVWELRAQIMLAREFPREETRIRERVLASCSRPEFCSPDGETWKAVYRFPRGNTVVSGAGVIVAREIARLWGNVRYGVQELPEEDPGMAHLRGQAIDLESNLLVVAEDRFRLAVQRKRNGVAVWVPTDDERDLRELKNRRGALLVRNCLLQLFPPDLVDLAVQRVTETMALMAKGDLSKDRKGTVLKVLARFSGVGVVRAQLERFIGNSLDEVTEDQLVDLRGAYEAIHDKVRTAASIFPPLEGPSEEKRSLADSLKGLADQGKQEPTAPTAPTAPAAPAEVAAPAAPQAPAASEAPQGDAGEPAPAGDGAQAQGGPQEPPQDASAPGDQSQAAEAAAPAEASPWAGMTRLQLQNKVRELEAVALPRDRWVASRKAAGIEGLSVAPVEALRGYLDKLAATPKQAQPANQNPGPSRDAELPFGQ